MTGKLVWQRASIALALALPLIGQAVPQTPPGASSTNPPVITLQDAIARARQFAGQIQTANINALLAREDRVQARAATLPSVSAFNQYIYTEGNGTPSGVFVANDGVHIYNEQAQVHQELLSIGRRAEIRRAAAAEAVAKARAEIASRGLYATVAQDYYAIATAQRHAANARVSLTEAERFLDITDKQEKGGEAAHADVVRAQLALEQRKRDVQESDLAIEKAKVALGVLIFPTLTMDFSIVDDLAQPAMLPPLTEAQSLATSSSPDVRAARLSVEQAGFDIGIARYGYLPSFALDFAYGLDARQLAINSNPDPVDQFYRHNLGYAAQFTMNIPVWNWGATRSKIRQAELRQQQTQVDLTTAQRTLAGNIATAYREAQVALAQIASLRTSSDLAGDNLRLTLLRYQAGEATAFEVSDAQSTLAQARNAYDDGLARYRVALANLQTLTGNF